MKIEPKPVPQLDQNEASISPDLDVLSPSAVADRALPMWAAPVTWVFAALISFGYFAIAAIATLFQTHVVEQADPNASWVVLGVCVVVLLSGLALEYAHGKSLSGFRAMRNARALLAQFVLVCFAAVIFAVVHYLLAIATILMVLTAWGASVILRRQSAKEPAWDFHEAEAISILSGRDRLGLMMAGTVAKEASLQPTLRRTIVWIGIATSLAISSSLVASDVLNPSAILASALITFWSGDVIANFFLAAHEFDAGPNSFASEIEDVPPPEDTPELGLYVNDLTVLSGDGKRLISDVSFDLAPGSVVGIDGASGAGKSILCQAIIAAQDLSGLTIRGSVTLNQSNLWDRSARPTEIPAVYLPETPLLLPSSGKNNLESFRGDAFSVDARRMLEKFLADQELADEICSISDATRLSFGHKKVLALSRAFALHPWLYLIDRPEDTATDAMIATIVSQIRSEQRLGRSFILITQNRALLEICDKLLVLQGGRMIEYGDAAEIREKQTTGWSRFSSKCTLENEDNLVFWASSQFKRRGDESNQRRVSLVVSELLAFACQSVGSGQSNQTVLFELKHFKKHCIVRMIDDGAPMSNAALQQARDEAEATPGQSRISPLATVLRAVQSFSSEQLGDKRATEVKIETYDPRLLGANGGKANAAKSG